MFHNLDIENANAGVAPEAAPLDNHHHDTSQYPWPFSNPQEASHTQSRHKGPKDGSLAKEQIDELTELRRQQAVLQRQKAWYDRNPSMDPSFTPVLWNRFLYKLGLPGYISIPTVRELTSLAFFYFPPRSGLKITICDYGDGKFESFEVFLQRLPDSACACCRPSKLPFTDTRNQSGVINLIGPLHAGCKYRLWTSISDLHGPS